MLAGPPFMLWDFLAFHCLGFSSLWFSSLWLESKTQSTVWSPDYVTQGPVEALCVGSKEAVSCSFPM